MSGRVALWDRVQGSIGHRSEDKVWKITKKSMKNHILIRSLTVLSLLPYIAGPTLNISVWQGEDALFNFTSELAFAYVHFGKKKWGQMNPDPLIIRVDEHNNYTKVKNTPYSNRLFYTGDTRAGYLQFVLHNAQVNESGKYTLYFKEVGNGAMRNFDFNLQVLARNLTSPKPSNETVTTRAPTTYNNQDGSVTTMAPTTDNLPDGRVMVGLGAFFGVFIVVLILIFLTYKAIIKRRRRMEEAIIKRRRMEEGNHCIILANCSYPTQDGDSTAMTAETTSDNDHEELSNMTAVPSSLE